MISPLVKTIVLAALVLQLFTVWAMYAQFTSIQETSLLPGVVLGIVYKLQRELIFMDRRIYYRETISNSKILKL